MQDLKTLHVIVSVFIMVTAMNNRYRKS